MHQYRCEAGIKCRIISGSNELEIYDVEKRHSDKLYSKQNMHLSITKTKLYYMQKVFIFKNSGQNVGVTVAHRVFVGLN